MWSGVGQYNLRGRRAYAQGGGCLRVPVLCCKSEWAKLDREAQMQLASIVEMVKVLKMLKAEKVTPSPSKGESAC